MFAGAAFTDQADVKVDSDVVDTLVSLGVVNGYTDGSFKPNDTVTRAEMAKMIYVLRTGNSDASAYNNDKTTFTDINGHWARGYVKYCQSLGIIAGQSATKFAPDQTVTAQEAAKMLLVTLGYNAEKAGLVGINWASKTNALADENGLLEDVTTSFTGPCPRQYAAQLMYNAIDASTVVWRDDAYTKYNYNGDENPTIGEKYMGLKYATGILMASGKVGLDNTGASKALVVKADEKQTVLNTNYDANDLIKFTDIKTDYSDLLGMAVKVMYKDKVYGVYATDDNDVNIAALASDLDTVSGEAKFKVDGTKYSVNKNGMTVYSIGVDTNGNVAITTLYKNVKSDGDVKTAINGIKDSDMEITVISNDNDEKVDAIFVNNKTFAKLTTVNSTSVSYKSVLLDMKGNTTGAAVKLDLEDDEPEVYDGYKKDDYVFVGADLYNDAVVIEKAQTISGKAESFKADSIKIDGKWHDYVLASGKSYTAKAGKTYTGYVYGSYIYYLTGESGSNSDVDTLLVKSVGDYKAMDEGVEAKVYFEDGTEKVISVTDVVTPKSGFDLNDWNDNESNGTDTVIYLDLITSEGLKTVETEYTGKASKFTKGMIISFTGTYEKANDDIAVVSNVTMTEGGTENMSGYIAISNDWSDSSKLVRAYDVYKNASDVANPAKVIKVAAGKVVSDSVVINIDEDNYKADDATPSKAEELSGGNGYYANAFVIVNSDNEIELLVYETSNRIKDNNKEIKLYTK